MRGRVAIGLVLCVCGLVRAEAAGPADIVGTWSLDTGQLQVESSYSPDGQYSCRITPAGGPTRIVAGQYKVDGDWLEVTLDGRDQPTRYTWRVAGAGTLELTDVNGNSTRMDRKAPVKPVHREPPADEISDVKPPPAISPGICGEWIMRNEQLEFKIQFRPDGTFSRDVRTAQGAKSSKGTFRVESGVMTLQAEGEPAAKVNCRLTDINDLEVMAEDQTGLRLVRIEPPAVIQLRQKALAGDAQAMGQLGDRYASGEGVPKDHAEATKWYVKAADTGIAGGIAGLGWVRVFGERVPLDLEGGVKLLMRAAGMGNSAAMCNVGVCYHDGRGVAKDLGEAARWYQKAADAGDVTAMCNLAGMYAQGKGVKEDQVAAFKLWLKAAELGNVGAMNSVGCCYGEGKGVEKNLDECYKWIRKSVDGGCVYAYSNLGECYEMGEGVAKDIDQALRNYRKAVDLGDGYGMYRLGRAYELGIGVAKNIDEAVKWYHKAVKLDSDLAKEALKKLGRD